MREEEWLACSHPRSMASALEEHECGSSRKWRLFLCAACRNTKNFRHRFNLPKLRDAVAVAEKHADGETSDGKLSKVHREVEAFARMLQRKKNDADDKAYWEAAYRLHCANAVVAATLATGELFKPRRYQSNYDDSTPLWLAVARVHQAYTYDEDEECAELACLVREVFGNPFRPVMFDLDWRTSDVMLLANGIYAEKAFDRMPILADALQDAGCDCDELLNHLRDLQATHVRGCWALDLVLEKE